MPPPNEAVAFRIGARWFCGWTRGGSIKTAWSLAGARLFQRPQPGEEATEDYSTTFKRLINYSVKTGTKVMYVVITAGIP
jgi:hypothetical protein